VCKPPLAASAPAPCWAGTWQTTGLWDARPWVRQRYKSRRNGHGRDDTRSGDGPYGTRSGDGPYGTRCPSLTPCPTTGDPAATGPTARDPAPGDTVAPGHTGRRDRRRTIRHAIHLVSDYARICPDMLGICSEYVRNMPDYARICPEHVRLFPMMSRCRVCPAPALRDASGPTIRLSRAAERATIECHGIIKENMFVNRRGGVGSSAMLGRGMADDGPSARPTVNVAET